MHRERDPTAHCHIHGVPRSLVAPFPIEIVQDSSYLALLSETEHDVRIIPLDGSPHLKNYRAWAGDSRGRWDSDTLLYEATIEDPKVSMRPWKIRMPLRLQKCVQILEDECEEGENGRRHDDRIDTKPALRGLLIDERLLDGVQAPHLTQAAAELRPGQCKIIAQYVQQRRSRVRVHGVGPAIDLQSESTHGWLLPLSYVSAEESDSPACLQKHPYGTTRRSSSPSGESTSSTAGHECVRVFHRSCRF
jgi:hypothetical protein